MKSFAFALDVLAILAFSTFARLAHQSADMPFGLSGIVETAWPFLIGVLVAWALFLLRRDLRPTSLTGGLITWSCAVFAGLGTWAVRHGELPHWSFMIVATVMSGLLLMGWRAVAGVAYRRRSSSTK